MRGNVAIVLVLALFGCGHSAQPANPRETTDASAAGSGPGETVTTNTDAGRQDAGRQDAGRQDASSAGDACTPTRAPTVPQVFVGEVMTVAEECGSADGGAPALVGPVPGTTRLPVLVALPYRDQSGLDEFLNEVSDPNSPLYRHYLTDDQLTAMFGPTVCDYDATVAWAESKGLTVVQTYPDRELLDLSAPVSIIDAVFHVTLSYYLRSDGTQFYAPDVDPSIDLSVPVLEVSGLDSCAVATPATAP